MTHSSGRSSVEYVEHVSVNSFRFIISIIVSNVYAKCFFWLCQLRRVRRSLDVESVKTLVHAFITTRLDYCNCVLAGASRSATDKLQRVLNAEARLVSGTRKFDRGLSRLLHVDLH